MTDNVDAVCGSRSNPQDYEGVEDMLLNLKLRCNSKACRYRHGTDFQAGLKIARAGFKTGDDEWFNKSWPESESEEEDSRQTAGEATMGASTARR